MEKFYTMEESTYLQLKGINSLLYRGNLSSNDIRDIANKLDIILHDKTEENIQND